MGSSFLHVTEESAALHAKHRTRHGHRLRRSQRRRLEDELSCGPTNCTRVMCTVSPFRAKSNIIIRVRSRLWVDTIEKVSATRGQGVVLAGTVTRLILLLADFGRL